VAGVADLLVELSHQEPVQRELGSYADAHAHDGQQAHQGDQQPGPQ